MVSLVPRRYWKYPVGKFWKFWKFLSTVFVSLKNIGNPYSPQNQENHENLVGSAHPPRGLEVRA